MINHVQLRRITTFLIIWLALVMGGCTVAGPTAAPTSAPLTSAAATAAALAADPTAAPTLAAPTGDTPAPTIARTPRSTRTPRATRTPRPTTPTPDASAAVTAGRPRIATPRPGDDFPTIRLNRLPPEAHATLALIAGDGPFPYRQDGVVFQNRERLLPRKASGYYHEYTVETPGSPDRGARRIVAGAQGEFYYTGDHYASFKRIVP